jgi:hypothetical protein
MYPVLVQFPNVKNSNSKMFVIYKDKHRKQILSTNKRWISDNSNTRMSDILVFRSMSDAIAMLNKITEKVTKTK